MPNVLHKVVELAHALKRASKLVLIPHVEALQAYELSVPVGNVCLPLYICTFFQPTQPEPANVASVCLGYRYIYNIRLERASIVMQ